MKSKFLVICLLIIYIIQAISFASEDVVKLGVEITEKTYKEKYNAGDTFIARIKITEACENFGSLIGALEFDKSILEVNKIVEDGIELFEDGESDGFISPKFVGKGNDNQIIFWIEDRYNRLAEGSLARITFTVKKNVSNKDIEFNFAKIEASDFDIKSKYVFKTDDKLNTEVNEKQNEDVNDNLDNIKDNIIKEEEEKLKLVLEMSENESGKNNNETTVKKESNKSTSSNGNSTKSTEKSENINKTENKSINWSKASNWVVPELEKANKENLIPETLDNLDYTKPINRKLFAAIAVKLYENVSKKTVSEVTNNPFEDTKDEYVLKAYELGITNGTSKTKFSPDSEITREQMATMMLRALDKAGINTDVNIDKVEKFVDEDEMHTWGKDAIYFMASKGIIKGISSYENRFGVKNNATIEQAIAISLRSISL